MVIKDLLSGDGAKTELKEVYKLLDMKDEQIGLYKQKDSLKESKIINLESIITKKDQQLDLERQKSNDLIKELKVTKVKSAFYKAGSGAAIILGVLLSIKR
jgi:hypothetical protein